jgi:hypothetical protein
MDTPSRRFSLVCLLIVIATISAFSQSTQLIPWDAETLLTWADFQGEPPANVGHLPDAAAVHVTIKWHTSYAVRSQRANGYSWLGSVQDLVVSNLMNPRFSWVVASKATPAILRHEQFHFNLNEVYRRKLAETLSGLQIQGSTAEATKALLDERIQETAAEILDRLSAIQTQYNQETASGTDSEAQKQWESDIQTWLATPSLAP